MFANMYNIFGAQERQNLTPWLIRLEFNESKMLDLDLTMQDIACRLNDFYDSKIDVEFSDDNSKNIIGRIRLVD